MALENAIAGGKKFAACSRMFFSVASEETQSWEVRLRAQEMFLFFPLTTNLTISSIKVYGIKTQLKNAVKPDKSS